MEYPREPAAARRSDDIGRVVTLAFVPGDAVLAFLRLAVAFAIRLASVFWTDVASAQPFATEAPASSDAQDYAGELPQIAATSPDRASRTFRKSPGFRVELVAAEPHIHLLRDTDGDRRADEREIVFTDFIARTFRGSLLISAQLMSQDERRESGQSGVRFERLAHSPRGQQ